MAITRVEQSRQVTSYLRRECTDQEVDAYYDELKALTRSPITRSEPIFDRRIGSRMLRRFRFGADRIAIFEYDPAEDFIHVLTCREFIG